MLLKHRVCHYEPAVVDATQRASGGEHYKKDKGNGFVELSTALNMEKKYEESLKDFESIFCLTFKSIVELPAKRPRPDYTTNYI